jgi:predicted esterase YcpF (UPF0227 family)
MILYLHGFRSSPQSYKARVMQQHMQELGRADEFFARRCRHHRQKQSRRPKPSLPKLIRRNGQN